MITRTQLDTWEAEVALLQEHNRQLLAENGRLREALEEYAVSQVYGARAREALKEKA